MQYGTRERFSYSECLACGALQIDEVPEDLQRHYRAERYVSWRELPDYIDKPIGSFSRTLRAMRTEYLISGRGLSGHLLLRAMGPPAMPEPGTWDWLRRGQVRTDERIFDFGCGTGELLRYMRLAGYRNLYGYDKFSGCSLHLPGLELAGQMPAPDRRFDLVMAHHSLEHLPDPVLALRMLASLLAPGGRLLIRVPVSQTHAWRTYGADWVQLDAPRHLVIPSVRSMSLLAERCGLVLNDMLFDSTHFQFLGSEQYRQDIALYGEQRSHFMGNTALFGDEKVKEFKASAQRLNAEGQADQACFFLKAKTA